MATGYNPDNGRASHPHIDNIYKDILDEEFQNFLELTYTLMKTFIRSKDRQICAKFIQRCSALDAASIDVKENRNEFFKYFLYMLQAASSNQPTEFYDKWYVKKESEISADAENDRVTKHWSADKKTYVAAKAISGYGTLVYIAVAYEPELGWQASGFSSYDF